MDCGLHDRIGLLVLGIAVAEGDQTILFPFPLLLKVVSSHSDPQDMGCLEPRPIRRNFACVRFGAVVNCGMYSGGYILEKLDL